MFGTRTLIIFLGILALSAAIDPDNICILLADGTQIVDDTNCAAYYTCNKGEAISVACPSGQYFNKDNRGCVPKSQATCVAQNENPCQGVSGEKFVAKPNSCSGYYYCKNEVATEGSCPDGLNFIPSDQTCKYKTEQGCSATGDDPSNSVDNNPDLLCAYIPNGVFFGSAANCKTWLKCTDNIVRSGSCDEYVFNVQTGSCVYSNTYDCQQLKGDSSQTGGTPPKACDPTTDKKLIANPDSCSSYLTCEINKYVAVQCPSGQFYDEDDETCTNRQDAKNNCDRCEGTTGSFVNAYQDDCVGYLICSNGKQIGKGKCDPGYYFNEVYASCVKGKHPEFGVCTVIPTCGNCSVYSATPVCGTDCKCPEGCPLKPACDGCCKVTNDTPDCCDVSDLNCEGEVCPDLDPCCDLTENSCTDDEDCDETNCVIP